ncbi:MAG: sigma-70 family RNA polymerase sigma factor [Deltaproteobacteria bacterium]|nr:sigma-70 family RNA polymerase sigma factor [Deltaproteobacteria bacterium]
MNDEELQRGYKRGDKAALEAVYWRHIDAVHRIVTKGVRLVDGRRAWLARRDLETDVVHDVFARAFAAAARTSYDDSRPLEPYLLQLARNVLVDTLRKERPREDAAAIETLTDEHEPPDPFATKLCAAAKSFVAGQDDETRRFVCLRYDEEKSQRDVANAMGVGRKRVRLLDDKLMHALKEHLATLGLWKKENDDEQ